MKTRQQKRQEAEERKRLHSQRTPDQQLAILRSRGITAGAEWDRLYAQVENGASRLPEDAHDKPVYEDRSTYPKGKA